MLHKCSSRADLVKQRTGGLEKFDELYTMDVGRWFEGWIDTADMACSRLHSRSVSRGKLYLTSKRCSCISWPCSWVESTHVSKSMQPTTQEALSLSRLSASSPIGECGRPTALGLTKHHAIVCSPNPPHPTNPLII